MPEVNAGSEPRKPITVTTWSCPEPDCTTTFRTTSPDMLARFTALHQQKRHGGTTSA
ncbi:hypothetical protein [Streptomyces sp. CS014]|uniref:hypothetical protein n=1 Tax=Streptomyces sp. CS014 TaxID=2162707 RepID=UPI0013A575D7|nr:hypothetical protein [Streptomyces sp. CS014]